MLPNHSPWLYQLNRKRPVHSLQQDMATDVAIIGGGIAGVSTAYYTLTETDKTVTLIEATKIAHGATGHNAGHVLSQFERSFSDLVDEFGLTLTARAQKGVESAWILLEKIFNDANLQTPYFQVTGYSGLTNLEQVLMHLNDNLYKFAAGLRPEQMMIAKETDLANDIPKKYHDFYTCIPQEDILSLLETDDTRYIAAVSSRKGCVNSALFTEELAGYLLSTYESRFTLVEQTPVKRIILKKDHAILETDTHTITANRVVLCTNGFESITIINEAGEDINSKFHNMVTGTVGYMAGFLEDMHKPPAVIRYFSSDGASHGGGANDDPYFYITRRPFEMSAEQSHNLISIGGPEKPLVDKRTYSPTEPYPQEIFDKIDDFLHKQYTDVPEGKINYVFHWHGIMGYTPNGVRAIGPEPLNPVLLYNLGCNGIGILTSVYGGKRITEFLLGKRLRKSIFDVRYHYGESVQNVSTKSKNQKEEQKST